MTGLRLSAAIVSAAIALLIAAAAPASATEPFGTWWTEGKDAKIKIVNCGGALCGSLVWISEPNDPETGQPKVDKNNPDASLQSRPLLGIPIVLNMTPTGQNVWQGKVYNSKDGGIYSGSFTLTSANSAQLKGCVMGGLICKGQTWTRAN
jgi:uncharacterized protein (DUF2147 family)